MFRETSTEELYPINDSDGGLSSRLPPTDKMHWTQTQYEENEKQEIHDDFFFPRSLDDDVNLWSTEDVLRFLRLSGLEDISGIFLHKLEGYIILFVDVFCPVNFEKSQIDGPLLLKIDDAFAIEVLSVKHSLRRRRLLRIIEKLKNHQVQFSKV